MTGRPDDADWWRPAGGTASAPSAVEDLLRATLDARADDVTWDPDLLTTVSSRARVPSPRRVPPVVAWLSAAAAAALVVGGVSVVAGGPGGGSPDVVPAGSPASTVRRDLPARFADARPVRPRRTSCSGVASLNDHDLQTGAPQLAHVTFDPRYTDPASPPDQQVTTTVVVIPTDMPSSDAASLGGTPGSVVGDPAGTGGQVRVTVTGMPTAEVLPTPSSGQDEVAARIAPALDDGRFAGLSLGPGLVVVHVVRGVDEEGARALVRTCAGAPGVDVRVQLVDRSEAQLAAVVQDVLAHAGRFPGMTAPWIDTQRNRVLVGVETMPTDAQRAWVAQRYGGVVAYWVIERMGPVEAAG